MRATEIKKQTRNEQVIALKFTEPRVGVGEVQRVKQTSTDVWATSQTSFLTTLLLSYIFFLHHLYLPFLCLECSFLCLRSCFPRGRPRAKDSGTSNALMGRKTLRKSSSLLESELHLSKGSGLLYPNNIQ